VLADIQFIRETQMTKYLALSLMLLLAGILPPAQADELGAAYVNLFKVQLSLAKSGEANAQFGLAQMYEQGLGTKKDTDKAEEWYRKAAKQGDIRAQRKLNDPGKSNHEIAKAVIREAEPVKHKPAVPKAAPAPNAAVKVVDEAAIRAEIEAKIRAEHAAKARAATLVKKRAEVKELLEEKHDSAKDPFE